MLMLGSLDCRAGQSVYSPSAMDYSSMKKLASMIGEEFKVIDSVTLENINLQRLIGKEKEYCTNLETLLKKNGDEIEITENESRRLKSKLKEVKNSGLLLKTSLESIKSSHKMVDLLKIDLMKQLHLEVVKTSEQNMKFESTIKKYEIMWESYKSTYEKFPLVSDLHKSELKLKQKSIQLAIQKGSVRAFEEKIKKLYEILCKREKVIVINISEKYLQREKLIQEKKTLELNIRLKEESLKVIIDNDKRGQPLGTLNLDSKKEFYKKPRTFFPDSLEESNKENIYLPADASTCTSSKTSFHRYEAILAKRYQSVPLLKLPPLSLLDSPPRKVRSVGNLLSPPKTEWLKDGFDDLTGKHVYDTDVEQWNIPDISYHEQNSLKGEKEVVKNDIVNGNESLNQNIPTNLSLEKAENETVSNDFQQENKYETKMPEVEIDTEGKEIENMEVDDEDGSIKMTSEVKHLPKQSNEAKGVASLNSVEFSYEPRVEMKCFKIPETATEEMKSPYFVSSYLNFLEIPKIVGESTDKAKKTQKINQSSDLDKKEVIVIDLADEMEEQEKDEKKNSEGKSNDVLEKEKEVSEFSHVNQGKTDSVQPSGMDLGDESTPQNNTYIIHDFLDKPNETTNDEEDLTHDSSVCQPNSNESQSYQFDMSLENGNQSYQTPLEFSQVSSIDSAEYAEISYASMSPNPSRIQSPLSCSPNINNQGRINIFGSPPGFNYKFSEIQQSSASALFGDSSPSDSEGKERKQSEVFNFAYDTKRNTSTMFKLF